MASSKSSKLSSSLPFELVEEILSWISVGSLVRFKSTCKQWYALLTNKRFIYKHLDDLSREQFIQIYNDNKSVQLFNPETQAPSCLQGTPEIMRMIHCDGLLLCQCIESSKGYVTKKLAVWNPFLSRFNWIEPPKSFKNFDVFGFGYDNVSRDNYKILRFCDLERSDTEIYEFKSKLWRSVDAALDSSLDLWHPRLQALSMNGNMYWIALRKKSESETEIFIQSFDFFSETLKDFGSVPFETDGVCRPRTGELVHSGFTLVLSGFGRERISLLHQHRRVKIEVWVTNKVTNDGAVSWS